MMRRVFLYLVLALLAAFMLTPMVWLVAACFKGNADLFTYLFFSPRPTLYSFRVLFREIPFLRYLMNSLFVSGVTVLLQLFFSSLGGYALAKFEFRGKKAVLVLMLATMIIPGQVLIAPLYELLFKLHLVNTYTGLISPWAVSVFGMFLFYQSFRQVPTSILEAGRSWNSFLWPQIMLNSDAMYTLPIGLSHLVGLLQNEYGALMAGTLLAVLPVGVLFFLLQREFISGLTAGAVKG